MGFLFNQKFLQSRNGHKWQNNSWESFQKIRKLLNFRKANHFNDNFRNSRRKSKGTEIPRKNFLENLAYLARLSRFPEIPEMLLHSSPEISENSNQNFHRMESVQGIVKSLRGEGIISVGGFPCSLLEGRGPRLLNYDWRAGGFLRVSATKNTPFFAGF